MVDETIASRLNDSTYQNEFFDFDPKKNKSKDKVFKCNTIFTNEKFWDSIQDSLYDTLGEGWSVILFQTGLKYGASVGEKARESIPDIHHAVKFLESYGLMSGWGRFKTSSFTIVDGKLANDVKVTVEESFFAKVGKKKKWDTPRCFFVAGLLAGIAEGLLGEGHYCVETKCVACDSKECEFLLTRRN